MAQQHAIVVGGSVTGLFAAFGAAQGFERVTIVERDELVFTTQARKGAPQGAHTHALLQNGFAMIKDFIPDLREQLLAAGCPGFDEVRDIPYLSSEGWRIRVDSPIETIGFRRPLFESIVRRNLLELPHVEIVKAVVNGLTVADGVVTGIRLATGDVIAGDLVVDASGRGSQLPKWLAEHGYGAPEEKQVRAYMGYTSQVVRIPEDAFTAGAVGIAAMPYPGHLTGGVIHPVDDGLHMMTAAGMMKQYPPGDREGLLDFLDTAPSPILGQIARRSEPIIDPVTYRVPGNRLRLWHELDPRPEGLVVTGDAAAYFNPIYAQGMTQAAKGGVLLRDCLANREQDPRPLSVRFQEALAEFSQEAFEISAMADAFYEGAELDGAEAPDPADMEYFTLLEQLATVDADVLITLVSATYAMELERLEDPELREKVRSWVDSGAKPGNQDRTRIPGVSTSVEA